MTYVDNQLWALNGLDQRSKTWQQGIILDRHATRKRVMSVIGSVPVRRKIQAACTRVFLPPDEDAWAGIA